MKTELKQVLDEVKSVVNERVGDVRKLAEQNAEQIGSLIVGGTGKTNAPAGFDDPEEYQNFARGFFASVKRRPVTDSEIDHDLIKQYTNAFKHWIRFGTADMPTEFRNAMSVGDDSSGGAWVPPEFQRSIIQKLHNRSPIRQLASTITIQSDSAEWPVDSGDLGAGWVSENETRSETTTGETGLQRIFLREMHAQPHVTQRLLDTAAFSIDEWLADKLADRFARLEGAAFVAGVGTDRPRGFLDYKSAATTSNDDSRDWGVLQYVPIGASGAFPTVSGSTASDPDALIDTVSKLHPGFRDGATWLMNRSTEAAVRKLKDNDGRYLVSGNDLSEQRRPLLLGYPIIIDESMPDVAADSYSIALANLERGYQIVDHVAGVRLLIDRLTTKGTVKYYSTRRVGGDMVNSQAFKLVKFGTS